MTGNSIFSARLYAQGGGGEWYSDTLYVSSRHFLGFKILNFNIFCGFQKKIKKYFLEYENFVDIFFGSSQNWTIFSGHVYAF